MKTYKKQQLKGYNKTKKLIKTDIDLLVLKENYPLYASKKHDGDKLLEFKRNAEKESKDHCLLDNSSWFGTYNVAKSYKTKETKLYKFKFKKETNLIKITKKNNRIFEDIFQNSKVELTPTLNFDENQISKIKNKLEKLNSDIPSIFLSLSNNQKALFEFKFAFGYLTLNEQYDFLRLLKFLLDEKFIQIDTRENLSIIKKVELKINYYRAANILSKKNKLNRISIYLFDKYAVSNLCRCLPKKYNIQGIYQPNADSFWFPNLILYKMNIEEFILFNPHKNLVYVKEM
jgi:hypothetical protein